jgi:hypothetical protein
VLKEINQEERKNMKEAKSNNAPKTSSHGFLNSTISIYEDSYITSDSLFAWPEKIGKELNESLLAKH